MRRKQLRVGDRVVQITPDTSISVGTRGILLSYNKHHIAPYYWRVKYDCSKHDGNPTEWMCSRDEIDFVKRYETKTD